MTNWLEILLFRFLRDKSASSECVFFSFYKLHLLQGKSARKKKEKKTKKRRKKGKKGKKRRRVKRPGALRIVALEDVVHHTCPGVRHVLGVQESMAG